VKRGIRYVLTGRSERCARIPVTAVRASIRWEHCDGIRSDH
jgi:hypothetical protein